MINTSDLTKVFEVNNKNLTAVDHVSFDIDKEEIFVLLGPNGAGKTTIVRMLSGILPMTKGSATVAGYDVRLNPDIVRKNIGIMTEKTGLYKTLTGRKNLEFFAKSYGLKNPNLNQKIKEYSEMMYLENALDSPISTYSKGMIQKISIIKSILHKPKVLFLDEPTSALDPKIAKSIRDLIINLRNESMTIMVTTHNLFEAEYLADKIGIIKEGKLIRFDRKIHFRNKSKPMLKIKFVNDELDSLDTIKNLIKTVVHADDINYDETTKALSTYLEQFDTKASAEINKALVMQGILVSELQIINDSLESIYLEEIDKE